MHDSNNYAEMFGTVIPLAQVYKTMRAVCVLLHESAECSLDMVFAPLY